MPTTPVLDLHRQSGAVIGETFGWQLPAVYSSLADEYEATTRRVALVDRSYIGRLELRGVDALELLDRLSTNKLDDLDAAGRGMYTVLTSNKGRILGLLFVLKLEDRLLVLTGPEHRRKVADRIDFYTFAEDVGVSDVTGELAMLAVTGPKAPSLLEAVVGPTAASVPRHGSTTADIDGVDVRIVRTDFAALPGYDLIVPARRAAQLWSRLMERGAGFGLRPVGMRALDLVRVERGVPVHGRELTEDHNPLEADLTEFISFNKGCYIGQEVVARLNTYDKVQRRLVGLSWGGRDGPVPGAGLHLDGAKVGEVTSKTWSPLRNQGIGLGYVRQAHAGQGTRLTTESPDGGLDVRVEGLPFPSG